jgi:hypothetical protein
VQVLVLEKDPDLAPQPDAVFPNNWFSVWPNGDLYLYPMRTANRRREVRPEALQTLLQSRVIVTRVRPVTAAPGLALEGTGALVFDHLNRIVYGARSERCDSLVAQHHAQALQYQLILFDTRSSAGRAFYHSNVVLSVGEQFAVIASDALCKQDERERVLAQLRAHKRDVIEISLAQAEHSFCANLLQLRNDRDGHIIALSQSAFDGFSGEQKQVLAQHGELLALKIDTIENVGGGSARWMMAEVF